MKRHFAILFALTFMVSGMAVIAEENAAESAVAENTEAAWTAPFEDGEWMSVPEWDAEIYLPAGWTLSEVTETGFIASDADEASTVTVTLEDFPAEESAEEAEPSEGEVKLSAFENYLMGLGEEYELALMGEREAAVFSAEESVTVRFVQKDQLVTIEFAPLTEDGIAGSALSVAETFYIYDEAEMAEPTAEAVEEPAEE